MSDRQAEQATREPVRIECDRCGSSTFAIYYDPIAQGTHAECDACGSVFLDV